MVEVTQSLSHTLYRDRYFGFPRVTFEQRIGKWLCNEKQLYVDWHREVERAVGLELYKDTLQQKNKNAELVPHTLLLPRYRNSNSITQEDEQVMGGTLYVPDGVVRIEGSDAVHILVRQTSLNENAQLEMVGTALGHALNHGSRLDILIPNDEKNMDLYGQMQDENISVSVLPVSTNEIDLIAANLWSQIVASR
jgi:hypothetical protein